MRIIDDWERDRWERIANIWPTLVANYGNEPGGPTAVLGVRLGITRERAKQVLQKMRRAGYDL